MEDKVCGKCKIIKDVSQFSKSSRSNSGYQSYCKLCNRSYLKNFNPDYLPKRRNGDQSKTGSYLHHIYLKILDRCLNPESSHWENYGGRGITVCERWRDWEMFKEDMMASYEKGLSIERIDVNGNYCSENCKWIPKVEQALNKRDTIRVTVDGELIGLVEYCRKIGFSESTATDRYRRFGDDLVSILMDYTPIERKSIEVKKFIADNLDKPSSYIIQKVQELFGESLTSQYVRQLKSDWKVGKDKSPLKKLFGDFEAYVAENLED